MTDSTDAADGRQSPLHEQHVRAGAQFTDFAGWRMPVRYASDLEEHRAVRERAGLFDLSHMAEILVVGPEAAAALDYALAGKLSAVEEGRAKYSLLLGRDGGILDDVVVYRTGEDRFLVVANAANRAIVARELLDRSAPFDAEVQDESDDIALLALQGPRAAEILENLVGLDVEGGTDALRALRYYRAIRAQWSGHRVLIARTGYTGEDGFELYVSPDAAPALWSDLLDTGAGAGLVPAGLAARDTLRLEAGMPLYGHELTTETLPGQAGLGRVVALGTKGDFVGRDGVETEPEGAPVLVGLRIEGRRAGRAGYAVYRGEDAVGTVTSGALSPTLGHPIAMAYIDASASAAGTELAIDVRGARVPATVVDLPFYRRPSA